MRTDPTILGKTFTSSVETILSAKGRHPAPRALHLFPLVQPNTYHSNIAIQHFSIHHLHSPESRTKRPRPRAPVALSQRPKTFPLTRNTFYAYPVFISTITTVLRVGTGSLPRALFGAEALPTPVLDASIHPSFLPSFLPSPTTRPPAAPPFSLPSSTRRAQEQMKKRRAKKKRENCKDEDGDATRQTEPHLAKKESHLNYTVSI